jgi:hypothetical protein
MHTRRISLLAGLFLAVACGGGAPAPADKPAAAPVPAPAKAVEEPAKVAAAPAEKHDEDEGCIHGKHEAGKGHEDGAACGGHGGAAAPSTGEPGHFGSAFALKDNKPLGQVLASGKDALPKDAVQVTGTIDSVCQKMGCWLVVKDGEAQARVLMKDHAFTVPTDVKGKPVVVEGTLATRTFSEPEVKHIEKDAGGDPAKASGERTEFVLTASGIKIVANS